MGIFQKYNTPVAVNVATENLDQSADLEQTSELPVADATTEERFDEQRQKLNDQNSGLEDLTSELDAPAKVDGEDDDLSVKGTKTEPDAEVAEGDFGREVEITDTKDGVHADADDSEMKFTNEMTSDLDQADRDVDAELDMIEQQEFAIESLDREISMLMDAHGAIEAHGFNPTAAAIMQSTGLLDGTALDTLALESINFTNGESDESKMAMEALGEKIKEKAAQWSAKILTVIKNSGEKIMSVLNPLYTKISGMISSMATGAWDKTKTAGAVVKAHPFKTAAAVVAAIVAVAGIVALVTSGAPAPGAKVDAAKAFLIKMKDQIGKIKSPLGTITSKISENGQKIVVGLKHEAAAFKGASLDVLGYTQTTVKVLGGQLTRAFDAIKHAWSALGTRVTKLASSVVSTVGSGVAVYVKEAANIGRTVGGVVGHGVNAVTGSRKAGKVAVLAVGGGITAMYLVILINAVFKLTRFVVVGGFRMIAATLNAIMPHSRTAEA